MKIRDGERERESEEGRQKYRRRGTDFPPLDPSQTRLSTARKHLSTAIERQTLPGTNIYPVIVARR